MSQPPPQDPPPAAPLPPPLPPLPFPSPFAPAPLSHGAPPPPPRIWPIFVAYFVILAVAVLVPAIALTMIAWLRIGPAPSQAELVAELETLVWSIPGLLGSGAFTGTFIASIAVLGAVLSPTPWRQRLRLVRSSASPLVFLAMILGILALSEALSCAVSLLGLSEYGNLRQLEMMFAKLSGTSLFAGVLVIGLLCGTAEELFFRGYVQTRFCARWGPFLGILAASGLFGLLHLDLVHAPTAGLLGVYMGYVACRTGSLFPAIACHVVNNVFSVTMTAVLPEVNLLPWRTTILATCLALLAICLAYVHYATQRPPQAPSDSQCLPQ